MGKYSILLCDEDQVYAKRLAAELRQQLKEQVYVITSTALPEAIREEDKPDILLTSQIPTGQWTVSDQQCQVVWLDDGGSLKRKPGTPSGGAKSDAREPAVGDIPCNGRILKYQAASRIARELREYFPQRPLGLAAGLANQKQQWLGVISPCRHESMLPFACTLAQQTEEKSVLLLVFMEFSGIHYLLEMEPGQGMERFILRLRKEKHNISEQIPLPDIKSFQEFDFLAGVSNPTTLYELTREDVRLMIKRIQCAVQYKTVIWAAGNMLQGIDSLFQCSKKVFVVEKNDGYSQCCQREFYDFCEKMQMENAEKIKALNLPVFGETETGEHLLYQWNQSSLGDIARRCMEESD